MPIFVTGGTGFLGINLIRLLVDHGRHVRLLVRANSRMDGLDSELIETVRGDVTDEPSIRTAMRGCDEVYHLAAWVQVSPWGRSDAWRVNVEGTHNVCSAALQLGVRRVVHTSSIATIAAGTLDDPADESTALSVRAPRIPYYETKLAAERVVLEHIERGLDAVIVNPTYLVGPWDVKPSAGRILLNVATPRMRFYTSRGGINFADARNVAAGLLLAMERGATGERYVLGGENMTYKEYVRRVAEAAGVPMPWVRLSPAGMFPFAAAGSVMGRLFPRPFRDINLSVMHSAFLEHFVSSAKANRELGYDIVSIDRAIADALRWFIGHGYLNGPTRAVG